MRKLIHTCPLEFATSGMLTALAIVVILFVGASVPGCASNPAPTTPGSSSVEVQLANKGYSFAQSIGRVQSVAKAANLSGVFPNAQYDQFRAVARKVNTGGLAFADALDAYHTTRNAANLAAAMNALSSLQSAFNEISALAAPGSVKDEVMVASRDVESAARAAGILP